MADITPEQLADAKAKYHLLVTGQAARVVADQAGDRVEYLAVNADKLLAYIRIFDPGWLTPVAPITARVSRPFKMIF